MIIKQEKKAQELKSVIFNFPNWEGTIFLGNDGEVGVQFYEGKTPVEFVYLGASFSLDLIEAQNIVFDLVGVRYPIQDR